MHNDHNWCKKEPKMKFLTFFSSLVGSIGLIFHIVKVRNSLHDLALVSIMFQMINYAYISIIYLKWGFQPCSRVGTSDWLDIAYFEITKWNSQFSHSGFLLILQIMIVQNVFQHLTLVPVGVFSHFLQNETFQADIADYNSTKCLQDFTLVSILWNITNNK